MAYSKSFQKVAIFTTNVIYRVLFKVTVYGKENITEGGAIMCSNHQSANDILLMLIASGPSNPVGIIAKKELFKLKIGAWFFTLLGAFPVDRGNADVKTIRTCIEIVKSGKKFVIFPEGTRYNRGQAKAGLGLIAQKADCPIIPIYITENYKMWGKVSVVVGEPIYKPQEKIPAIEFSQRIVDRIYEIGQEYENRNS